MRSRPLLLVLVLALGVVLLGGVDPVLAQKKTTVRMAAPPVGLHELPLMVADVRGYFAEEGLEVTITFMRGGSEAAAALMGGNIDVMDGAVSHALNLREKGMPVKMLSAVAGLRDFALVVDAKRHGGISAVKDLKGLRIATPRRGSDGDLLVRFLLDEAGLNPDRDVTLIQIGGYDNHLKAIEKGEVDASMILEPFLTVGVRAGTIKPVVDLLKGEGPDILQKRTWTALIVTEKFFRDRRETCEKLVRAVARAVKLIREDQAGTLEVAQKHFPNVAPVTLKEILRRHVETPRGQGFLTEISREAIEVENRFLTKFGLLKEAQKFEEVVATDMARYW